MAITDTQKIDYLWKKLGYGVSKTDQNSIKNATNESIASPLLLRGDKIWTEASSIPSVIPSSSSLTVEIYDDTGNGLSTVETTNDATATANRTWKTGITDWIPPEFGSTYQVKVYIDSAGAANPQSTGSQIFAAGSGNDDQWFFDYQSGVLHFIGNNLPSSISGNVIYIAGARYKGAFGTSVPGAITEGDLQGSVFGDDSTLLVDGVNSTINSSALTMPISIPDGNISSNYIGFGNDDDLKIFHNGNHSIIRETGTGSLYLQSDDNVIIAKDSGVEIMIQGIADGAVELYYDNVKKFETSADGVIVTGSIFASTIDTDDSSAITITPAATFNSDVTVENDISLRNNLEISDIQHTSANEETHATTSPESITQFDGSLFSSGKLIVQVKDNVTSEVQVCQISVVHNTNTASTTEYSNLFTGLNPLATFSAAIRGSYVHIDATAASANSTTYKVLKTLIRFL